MTAARPSPAEPRERPNTDGRPDEPHRYVFTGRPGSLCDRCHQPRHADFAAPAEPREGLREALIPLASRYADHLMHPDEHPPVRPQEPTTMPEGWFEEQMRSSFEDGRKQGRAETPEPGALDVALDARRYRRLRILGAAPGNSWHLDNGMVLTFTGLDDFLDRDLKRMPSRGEAR